MKTLDMSFTRVEGGCTFYYMVKSILNFNGVTNSVKIKKNWRNDKTVFIVADKKYIIADNSYIFNYDGFLELEEYNGATRDLSSKCQSPYMGFDKDYDYDYDYEN